MENQTPQESVINPIETKPSFSNEPYDSLDRVITESVRGLE